MAGKMLYNYKVVFRGKLGGIPDYRIVLAHNTNEAYRKVKNMFKGDIKIDNITRADKTYYKWSKKEGKTIKYEE